jgi:cytochrome b561
MVTWRSSDAGWGAIARLLHWAMALALLAQMTLGWVAVSWRLSPTKLELFVWHKTLGIVLLALVVLRLLWRVTDRAPAPAPGPTWQRRLAGVSHGTLYVLMLVMPISGWVIQSASGFPFKLFGLLELPALVGKSKAIQTAAEYTHLVLFWSFAVLILVHAAAALHHHWVRRDAVLERMLVGPETKGG